MSSHAYISVVQFMGPSCPPLPSPALSPSYLTYQKDPSWSDISEHEARNDSILSIEGMETDSSGKIMKVVKAEATIQHHQAFKTSSNPLR